MWITPNLKVFLETFSPVYKQAYDFLIAISDPVCRPYHIHEYKISSHSLYAAASLGLQTSDIINALERFSKVELHETVKKFITRHTQSCGKVKLVMKKARYFIESTDSSILAHLLTDPEISAARKDLQVGYSINDEEFERDEITRFLKIKSSLPAPSLYLPGTNNKLANQEEAMGFTGMSSSLRNAPIFCFEVSNNRLPSGDTDLENVRRKCRVSGFPLLEEYDFRHDSSLTDIAMNLRPIAQIRDYQEKSLSKMFGNGRARSGIIVLPCGAGKTLVGITAASTVKKSCLVFATTAVSVLQWRDQFLKWSNISRDSVFAMTANQDEKTKESELSKVLNFCFI